MSRSAKYDQQRAIVRLTMLPSFGRKAQVIAFPVHAISPGTDWVSPKHLAFTFPCRLSFLSWRLISTTRTWKVCYPLIRSFGVISLFSSWYRNHSASVPNMS